MATNGGSKIEVNKDVGPVCTIMRVLTSKDGDLSSYLTELLKIERITQY